MEEEKTETVQKVKGVSIRLLLLLLTFACTIILFIILANQVVYSDKKEFDQAVFALVEQTRSKAFTDILLFFTFFGSSGFLLPAYILLSLYYFILRKERTKSLNFVAIGLGSVGLMHSAKAIFQRQRPLEPFLYSEGGFSFPSGHSLSAYTFFGLLIYIIYKSKYKTLLKIVLILVFFTWATLVAYSRVYLKVHYASDVIGGLCLSFIWLTTSIYIFERLSNKRKQKNNLTAEA